MVILSIILSLKDIFEVLNAIQWTPNQGYCRGAGQCMIGAVEEGSDCCYTLECPQHTIAPDKCHSESASRPTSASPYARGKPSSFATQKSTHCLDNFGDGCIQEKLARWDYCAFVGKLWFSKIYQM